jgi:hypothetical protein
MQVSQDVLDVVAHEFVIIIAQALTMGVKQL